ncbi:MAG: beta strand repeat-containing protein, partial [Planctomyces sp.]
MKRALLSTVAADFIDFDTSDTHTFSIDNTGTLGTVTNNNDGTFTYDPNGAFESLADGQTTTDSFTYTVNDGHGGEVTKTVTITVTGQNDAPVVQDVIASVSEDGPSIDVSADFTDVDASDTHTFTIDSTGTLGSVTNNNDGTFTYDPNGAFESLAAGESTTDSFTYTVNDGHGGEVTKTVTITITGQNDAPVVQDVIASVSEEGPSVDVAADFTDVDSTDTHTFSIDNTGTLGSVTNNNDGTFTYDPNGAFESLADGQTTTDSFTYTVNDGHGGEVTKTVTITITGENDAPVVHDVIAAISEDGPSVGLYADFTDVDTTDTHTFTIDSSGTLGSVTNNNDGTFTYDPNGAFESLADGETTTDSFTYTVNDGHGGEVTKTVTVTITGQNDAPVVDFSGISALVTTEDSSGLVITGVSVSDVDATTVELSVTLSVVNGTINVDPVAAALAEVTVLSGSNSDAVVIHGTIANLNAFLTGTGVSYTPDEDYNTVDGGNASPTANLEFLTVTATDDLNLSSIAEEIGVTVTEVNDAPVSSDIPTTINEDGSVSLIVVESPTAMPGPQIEANTQTVELIGGGTTLAENGAVSFNFATGEIIYSPNEDFYGSDSFSYLIRDNGTTNGDADPLTAEILVTVTINPVNDAPVFTIGVAQTISEDDTTPQSVIGFISGADLGPENETSALVYGPFGTPHSDQTATYTVTSDIPEAFSSLSISSDGTLSYTLNHEYTNALTAGDNVVATISVILDDQGGNEFGIGSATASDSFTITISGINDAPSAVTVTPILTTLEENSSTASSIPVATLAIVDIDGGTNNLLLTGPDAVFFEIVNDELHLKAGTVLDFETQSSYSVTVEVDDASVGVTPDASATFTLTLTNVLDTTTGADRFEFSYSDLDVTITHSINGGTPVSLGSFALTTPLVLEGLAADDSVVINGTAGNDTFVMNGSDVTVNGATLTLNGPAVRTFAGGFGDDTYGFSSDSPLGLVTVDESLGGTDTLDFSSTSLSGVTV